MYNNHLVYKVVIWVFFGISLCEEKVALNFLCGHPLCLTDLHVIVY